MDLRSRWGTRCRWFLAADRRLKVATLDSARWAGEEDESNLVIIFDRSGQLDFDGAGETTVANLNIQVTQLRKTWIGDSDLDGEFGSSDFVKIYGSAKYEQDQDARRDECDWTGDLRFNSSDLVAAFSDGGFEKGPRVATVAVPEPPVWNLVVFGWVLACAFVRRAVN